MRFQVRSRLPALGPVCSRGVAGRTAVKKDLRTIGSLLRSPSAAGRGRTHGMLHVVVRGRFVEAEQDRQHAILSLYTRAPSEKVVD